MSSIFSISSVTDAGITAMQEALDHGYTMTFTSMKTGNGVYTTGEDVSARTALKSLKNTYTIGSIEEDADGATLSAVFTNYDGDNILVAEDYKINEIGIFCTVNSIEYLYAIAAVPNDDGMEMPAYDVAAQNLTQFVQEWYVANSNDADIAIAPAGAYVPVTDIVDNLTSTATTKPLSANQGRMLDLAKTRREDLSSIICTGSTNATGSTITTGTYFYLNKVLCEALADIANEATFTLNTNYKVVTVGEELTQLNASLAAIQSAELDHQYNLDPTIYIEGVQFYTCPADGYGQIGGNNSSTDCVYLRLFDKDSNLIGQIGIEPNSVVTNSIYCRKGMKLALFQYGATPNEYRFYALKP